MRINKNCTIAVHIAPIAKPIKAKLDPLTSNLEIKKDNIKLIINAPINEPIGNIANGADGNSMMIITAAKLAPLEIPITSGEASGFRTTPWIIAPDIAKLLPIISPNNVLGILYSFKIKLSCVKMPLIASIGFTITEPIHRLKMALITNNIVTILYLIICFFLVIRVSPL
ncbi:Uncharacterised protein [Streptococcus pneumoniae]|nr:Uncharacterised protein [Streptococcus pneumoniae]